MPITPGDVLHCLLNEGRGGVGGDELALLAFELQTNAVKRKIRDAARGARMLLKLRTNAWILAKQLLHFALEFLFRILLRKKIVLQRFPCDPADASEQYEEAFEFPVGNRNCGTHLVSDLQNPSVHKGVTAQGLPHLIKTLHVQMAMPFNGEL